VEVRQDWKFANEVFGFPAHNTVEGCCWACKCTPAEVKQLGKHQGLKIHFKNLGAEIVDKNLPGQIQRRAL
jgi:methyl coenzyme M reductase subunit C